jgi:uncharacterized membrane protein
MAYSFYTVIELVPAATYLASEAYSVSSNGRIGGISVVSSTATGPGKVATLWLPLPGTPENYVSELVYLPHEDQNDSVINDLNDTQAVGNVLPDSIVTQSIPFLIQSGAPSLLPNPSGNAQANAISANGIVVGATNTGGSGDSVGYYYNSSSQALAQIEALFGQSKSSATAIDTNGDIVAGLSGSNGFVFRIGGGILDLGPVYGVTGVNNQGVVVGTSQVESPVYCDSRKSLNFDAVPLPQDFRTLAGEAPQGPGQGGFAYAINNFNDVVGSCYGLTASGGGNAHAFISTTGSGGVDLNYLIPHDSGWALQEAYDINDNGQIVGMGTLNGQPRGFLLNPKLTIIGEPPVRIGRPVS